jgi:hypothetical protein
VAPKSAVFDRDSHWDIGLAAGLLAENCRAIALDPPNRGFVREEMHALSPKLIHRTADNSMSDLRVEWHGLAPFARP